MLNIISLFLFQKPFGTPNPDEGGIDLSSPFDLIMFIILPLAMIVFYIYWRRSKKKHGE